MTNAPFALDRREFIALAGGLAAVLVVGDGAYFSSRRSAAHAQPVPSESGTLTQPETPLNGTIASPNTETAAAATTSPETESAAATNTEMPPTTLEDLPWNLRLVNRDHPLAADFAPSNLAELPDASWVEPHVNHRVDARIVEDLTAMLTAAEAAGTHPIICSSFRTFRSARRCLVLRGSVSGSGKRRRGYPCTSPGLDAPKGRAFPSLTAARDCQPSPAGGRRSALAQTDSPKCLFLFHRARRRR